MAQYDLNLHDYFRIIRRRRWVILMTTVAVLGSVAVFTNLQVPVYQATTTVKVEQTMSIPGMPQADMGGWDSFTALNTEVKIIKSALVAELTARRIGIVDDNTPASKKEGIIVSIQGKIDADRVGDTNLITISATSSNAEETAKLSNAAAEVYIRKGIEDRSRRARELRQFIESQLEDAESKLKGSEDALRGYTERSGAKGIGGYLTSRLLDLQNRKSDLLKKYTNQHPEVQRIVQQISNVEDQMKALPAEELESARLTRDIKINEELYTLLAKRYKESQISEADRVQSAFIVTPAIRPTAPIKPNRRMNLSMGAFLGIFFGFILAIVIENLDTSIGTIEDVEKYLSVPVLGVVPRVEPDSHTRAMLPPARKGDKSSLLRSKLIVYHSNKSPFVESYHTLRTNLKFTLPKARGNIIAITSAGIGEGKTLTAANFGLAAAQSGIKTLLVEADLRMPSVHKVFGLPRDPGFSDCLIGTRKWTSVVRGTTDFLMSGMGMEKILQSPGIENLHLVTSGPIPPNPIDLFNAAQIGTVFSEMSEQYDLVILDCPPVLLFADTLILGTFASGTVFIYRVGKMARGALKRAKDQLTNLKVNVLGVVLNDITSSDLEPHYGYYYYSNKYYSSRDTGKEK
jgi:tyrosine-protein kinase Etk/Wzc